MKVIREKPSQRKHHRVNAPLMVTVCGTTYSALDWGLGGFALKEWKNDSLRPGDQFTSRLCLPFQGFEITFDAQVEIVRLTEDKLVAVKFVDNEIRNREIMSHFIEELVRGSMVSIDDTILRIDSPVTPVSTKPDPSPLTELPTRRWPMKLIAMTTFYMSAGLALLLYITFTVYANYFSLEVDSGVVAAPIEKIVSTTDGQISKVSVELDALAMGGEKLIIIEDAGVEHEIELAKVNIERIRSELEQKHKELEIEREKLDDYRYVTHNTIDELNSSVESLSKQLRYAKKDVDRFSKLIVDNLVSHRDLDNAKSKLAGIEGGLDNKVLELSKYRTLLKKINAGRYFTGERFEGNTKELEAEVNRLKEEVSLTTRELVALYEQRERLTIKAPGKGRLIEIMKSAGSSTKRGETIALFERDENRVIEVYLTQEEVIDIRLGRQARVYFPSKDIIVNTMVSNIDRTEGFIDEIQSRYNWRGVQDRTAKVTLEIIDYPLQKIRQEFSPGLPAVVIFPGISTGIVGNFINSLRSQMGEAEVTTKKELEIDGIYL